MNDFHKTFFKGAVTFASASPNIQLWRKRDVLLEVNIFSNNTRPTVNYKDTLYNENAAFGKKIMLRVSMIMLGKQSRPDLLDRSKTQCSDDMLCLAYPSRNRSFSTTREPTCCLGLMVDILLLLKDALHVEFYIYEVEDRAFGAELNGSWNGLIGDILSGKADIVAAGRSVSNAGYQLSTLLSHGL